jgi:hypothetical protein
MTLQSSWVLNPLERERAGGQESIQQLPSPAQTLDISTRLRLLFGSDCLNGGSHNVLDFIDPSLRNAIADALRNRNLMMEDVPHSLLPLICTACP